MLGPQQGRRQYSICTGVNILQIAGPRAPEDFLKSWKFQYSYSKDVHGWYRVVYL
jgi:hypothetical protein